MRLKPNTQKRLRGVVRRDILPALGKVRVAAVKPSHVIELQQSLSGRPVAANTAVKVLSHMYRLGEGWGLVPEGCNPCREVKKHPERRRERFLTDVEFSRLGRVMEESLDGGRDSPTAVAVIRLLMLTGCRKSEILTLRWTDVDLEAGALYLADAKSGPRTVQLAPTAARVLEALPRRRDSPWVFPGNDRDGRFSGDGLDHIWQTIRARAGLEDVRLHDLRHSYASRALALGEGLPIIGRLLRHSVSSSQSSTLVRRQ